MRFFENFPGKIWVFRITWIRKTLVLTSLPLMVGTMVVGLLLWAEEPGFSEATLEILTKNQDPSPAKIEEGIAHPYINLVMKRLQAPGLIFLLGCQLAVHDLTSPKPFHPPLELQDKYPEKILEYAAETMAEMVRNLKPQPQDPMLDSLLSEILVNLKYDYMSLNTYLTVKVSNADSRIRIMAQTEHTDLSTYLVNTFSSLFIEYNKAVDSEQGESSWISLKKMLAQKRDGWEKSREALRFKQNELQVGEGKNRKSLIRRIRSLELDKKEIQARIRHLRAKLNRQIKNKAVPVKFIYPSKQISKDELLIELGEAQAKIDMLESELLSLKNMLEQQDEQVLKPLREEEKRLREDYLSTKEQFDQLNHAKMLGPVKVVQVSFGQSRYQNPFAVWLLAALSFTAALFLWILFLFRLGYLRG